MKQDFKQNFISKWAATVAAVTGSESQPPSDEMVEVFEKHEPTSSCYASLSFEESTVDLPLASDWAMPLLKAMYDSFDDFLLNNENCNLYRTLTLRKKEDVPLYEYVKDAPEIGALFKNYHLIEQAFADDSVKPLSVEDIVGNDDIPEELKGLAFAQPRLDLTGLLKKVDDFTTPDHVVNPKGRPLEYSLYKGELLDIDVTFLACEDGSTDRTFRLAVPNTVETAKDASGWLCRIPGDLVKHIKWIKRQGEKYAFGFDIDVKSDEFKKKYDSEWVRLDGDTYFSKLVFES